MPLGAFSVPLSGGFQSHLKPMQASLSLGCSDGCTSGTKATCESLEGYPVPRSLAGSSSACLGSSVLVLCFLHAVP